VLRARSKSDQRSIAVTGRKGLQIPSSAVVDHYAPTGYRVHLMIDDVTVASAVLPKRSKIS
jgi:hypothetical protein